MTALDWIFSTPTFRATDFEKHAGIPVPTAKRILRCLENAEILAVIREASGRRPRVLCLEQLLTVAEGRAMTPSLWIMKPQSVIHKEACRSPVIHKPPCPAEHLAPSFDP